MYQDFPVGTILRELGSDDLLPAILFSKNPINLNWHVGIDQLQVAESKGLFLHWRFFYNRLI